MQQHNPLRLIASSAALTRTHASYPSHSSSSVVFGAAKTCRNTSGVAGGRSGAQRKDRTVTGGGCQEVGQANPMTPTHASNPKSTQNRVPKVAECVCLLLLTFTQLVNQTHTHAHTQRNSFASYVSLTKSQPPRPF